MTTAALLTVLFLTLLLGEDLLLSLELGNAFNNGVEESNLQQERIGRNRTAHQESNSHQYYYNTKGA